MTPEIINTKHQSRLITRFKQTIWVTILLISLALVGTVFFSYSEKIILALFFNIIILLCLFPIINREKLELAKQIYLWANISVVSYTIWITGGLSSSSGVLAYPMFLMIAALICSPRTFYFTFLFILSVILAMGLSTINGMGTVAEHTFSLWDLGITVILLAASGFTAWRFSNDMKHALKSLKIQVINAKQSHNKIERLINFDFLTSLVSRSSCEEQFSKVLQKAEESSEVVSLLFLDVDNFKFINDYYNHATGDELLKTIATRLKAVSQDNDIACRLSGDEFILIITRPQDFNLYEFIDKILHNIAKPVEISDQMIEVTVSIGVALSQGRSENFEDILRNADLAMYQAKKLGKNKYYFYDERILKQTTRKLQLINGLKDALKNNDLELFIQPKVDLANGKIHSAEALLRWVKNSPYNTSPAEFIPLIESTELICDIGEWVINEACRLCKHLQNNGFEDLTIAVNISSAQLMRGGLENIIIKALQESQLEPRFLELELTEHILFKDDNDIIEELNRLKELGLSLSIDDFGTGYSNLSYLRKFNVDSLKIDRSFVQNIHKLPDQYAIVDAIIKMGKTLGLTIIAEGVESDDEWNVLKSLSCDIGQGYLWSKPVRSQDFLLLKPQKESSQLINELV